MQRIALRTGGPARHQIQQRAAGRGLETAAAAAAAGDGTPYASAEWDGLDMASASLLGGGAFGARWDAGGGGGGPGELGGRASRQRLSRSAGSSAAAGLQYGAKGTPPRTGRGGRGSSAEVFAVHG
jgi:hypothetical protein